MEIGDGVPRREPRPVEVRGMTGPEINEKESLKFEGVLSLGYGILPMMVAADRRLSKGAKILYGVLASYARDKGSAYPKQKTLADILNLNVQRVSELTSELEMYGYIEKTREGKSGGITYTLKAKLKVEVEEELFGTTVTKRPRVPKKKKEVKVPKEVSDRFYKRYEALCLSELRIDKPDIRYSRDHPIVLRYIEKYGIETMLAILDLYFQDKWARDRYCTITCLQPCFQKLYGEYRKRGGGNGDGYGFKEKMSGVR